MFNQIKNLKYTPIFLATLLVACGGGGDGGGGVASGGGGGSSAQVNNAVNLSGIVEADPGKNLPIASRVNALRTSVSTHMWVISQVSGETAAASNSPTIADKDCVTANKTPGTPATTTTVGTTGSSNCVTSLIIPSTIKPSEWSVKNIATTTDGNSATGGFTLKIKSPPPSTIGFSVITPNLPQIQVANKISQLSASYVVNAGVKVDSVKYTWKQLSGPPVTLSGASTASPFFLAKTIGEYVFRVSVTISSDGKEETQDGDIVVNVTEAVAAIFFEVQAGDVQIGKIGVPVSLIGTVTGNAAVGTLAYEWSQVSGPQQVIFANEKSLNASFIPQASGSYVFQLKVSNSEGFKTATTTVSIDVAKSTIPFFAVTAGDVQIGVLKTIVPLKGTVIAGIPAPTNLTYQWVQKSGTPVALANSTSLQASFIPVVPGQYEFELAATSDGVTKTSSTTVAVEAAEIPSFSVSAGDAQSTGLNGLVVLKGAITVGTPAPTNVTYQWIQKSGPSVTLSNATSLQASFTSSVSGKYVFELTATANGVSKTSMTTVDVAQATFSVTAGDIQLGALKAIVSLKGTVIAGTPAPTSLTYRWVQTSGPSVTLSNPTSLQPSFIPDVVGQYEFQFSATSNGITQTSSTKVVVEAVVVAAPFFSVSAGDAQIIGLNVVTTLKGILLTGTPAPTNVTYQWVQKTGTTVSISNPTSLQATFIASVAGTYIFELTATSNGVAKTSLTTIVAAAAPSTPTETPFFSISAGDAQISAVNTVATLKAIVSVGTPPPSNITYQWVQKTGPAISLSNPTSLQASFIPSVVGDYQFEITATSNGVVKTSITLVSVK